MRDYTISIVIPSLGGNLCDTLDSINEGSVRPDEIVICLPNNTHSVKHANKYKNLVIKYAQKYGQVYQRIIGFKNAKGGYVLQMDDDIILEKNCLENLLICLMKLGNTAAIAPAYFKRNTNSSLYKKKSKSLFHRAVYWVANGSLGYEPGVISLSGINFGLNFSNKTQDFNESEWLPGGCIMHFRENLIMKDYFPFNGKAYSEDLIHSFLLKERGLKLYICNDSVVYTDVVSTESVKEIYKQYIISKYVNSVYGIGLTRLKAYYLIKLIFFLFKKGKKFTKRIVI